MKKLKIDNEFKDEQQEKHSTYLNRGFKLISTQTDKDGTVIRKYIN